MNRELKKTVTLKRLIEMVNSNGITDRMEVSQLIFLLRKEFSTKDIEELMKMFTEELIRRVDYEY